MCQTPALPVSHGLCLHNSKIDIIISFLQVSKWGSEGLGKPDHNRAEFNPWSSGLTAYPLSNKFLFVILALSNTGWSLKAWMWLLQSVRRGPTAKQRKSLFQRMSGVLEHELPSCSRSVPETGQGLVCPFLSAQPMANPIYQVSAQNEKFGSWATWTHSRILSGSLCAE